MDEDLVTRLRKRAAIRRQIPGRKSVQEGKPDRMADLLDEAATEIEKLQAVLLRAPLDVDFRVACIADDLRAWTTHAIEKHYVGEIRETPCEVCGYVRKA